MFNLRILLALALIFPSIFALTIPHTLIKRASSCSDNTDKLVAGINKNIDLQKQEQAQLKVMQKLVDGGNTDTEKFNTERNKFVDIVNAGIDQRKDNQALAKGNSASDGLATVAKAQAAELKAVQGLTGDAKTDDNTFSSLSTMFSGGISQNQKNAKAVCALVPSKFLSFSPRISG